MIILASTAAHTVSAILEAHEARNGKAPARSVSPPPASRVTWWSAFAPIVVPLAYASAIVGAASGFIWALSRLF